MNYFIFVNLDFEYLDYKFGSSLLNLFMYIDTDYFC